MYIYIYIYMHILHAITVYERIYPSTCSTFGRTSLAKRPIKMVGVSFVIPATERILVEGTFSWNENRDPGCRN